MLKLLSLFVGLALLASSPSLPSPSAAAPAFLGPATPPPYATRDIFAGLALPHT
jgi:hypothetical protein